MTLLRLGSYVHFLCKMTSADVDTRFVVHNNVENIVRSRPTAVRISSLSRIEHCRNNFRFNNRVHFRFRSTSAGVAIESIDFGDRQLGETVGSLSLCLHVYYTF